MNAKLVTIAILFVTIARSQDIWPRCLAPRKAAVSAAAVSNGTGGSAARSGVPAAGARSASLVYEAMTWQSVG